MRSDVEDPQLALFEGFGIELEYMIVSRDTLDVAPICDELLRAASGGDDAEIERGDLAWSNELVLHVVELKTNGPATTLSGLPELFHQDVVAINGLLEPHGARLMPAAMHPWMNPDREARLWPHEYTAVYQAFDRIFGCKGHGWANLQSAHINLPFSNDAEFGQLHAAIRLLLPILPALSASSPVVEGQRAPHLDYRMDVYRRNSVKVPSVAGRVIPEGAFSRAEYDRLIFEPMFRDIAPHDPDGVLRHEWLNARGAIARFDRGAIEIRVLDVQECPLADIAIAHAVVGVLKALIGERWCSLEAMQSWPVEPLARILSATIERAEGAAIGDPTYLAALGFEGSQATALELWRHLLDVVELPDGGGEVGSALEVIVGKGSLATRITTALGSSSVRDVYERLCDDLHAGRLFGA